MLLIPQVSGLEGFCQFGRPQKDKKEAAWKRKKLHFIYCIEQNYFTNSRWSQCTPSDTLRSDFDCGPDLSGLSEIHLVCSGWKWSLMYYDLRQL
jgi:hypothetical protein